MTAGFSTVLGSARGAGLPHFILSRDGRPSPVPYGCWSWHADVRLWVEEYVPVIDRPDFFEGTTLPPESVRHPARLVSDEHGRVGDVLRAQREALACLDPELARQERIQLAISDAALALACSDLLTSPVRRALYMPWCEQVTGWDGFPDSWQQFPDEPPLR